MRRALPVVLLQVGAACLGACNGCSESGASPSVASEDAATGAPDARPDHGSPTPDANKPDSDSGPYDSGGDAGQPPPGCGASADPEEAARWEGWVPVYTCPDGCAVCRPADIVASVAPLEWIPCDNAVNGCTMLATPWAEGQNRAFGANAWVERVDGKKYLTTLLQAGDRMLDGTFELIDGAASMPVSVWGDTISTGTTCGHSGGLRIGQGFGSEYVMCADRSTKAVFRAPLDDFRHVSTPLFTLDEEHPGTIVRYFAAMHPCGEVLAFELASGYGLWVTDLATLETSYAFWGELEGHKISNVHCAGDALFFTHDQVLPYEQWVRRPDGTLVKLVANADSMAIGLGSDGIDLAWMQAYDPDATLAHWNRVELWTSPFATSPQALAPQLLGRLPIDWLDFTLVVGAGYAAHSTIPGEAPRLYRLSDGEWAIAPEIPGLQLPRFIHIDEQEVFLWGAKAGAAPTDYVTIVRMPISAFGPFEPLPP